MRKRLISIMLTLALVLGLLPSGAVLADETYDVWVKDVQVTSANLDDVLGDGGSVAYDPQSSTLTLTNANIDAGAYGGDGIRSDGNLVITGTGTLKKRVLDDAGYTQCGIRVDNGDLTINADLIVDVDSGQCRAAIYVPDGTLTIPGGNVEIKSMGYRNYDSVAIIAGGDVVISGSNVKATEYGGGIRAAGSVTITGATVMAWGYLPSPGLDYGIYAGDTLSISNSTVTIHGSFADEDHDNIYAGNGFILGEGLGVEGFAPDTPIDVLASNHDGIVIRPISEMTDCFELSFHPWEGTGDEMPKITGYGYGDSVALPECTYTLEGQEFDGWCIYGTQRRIEPGETVTLYGNETAYARWKDPGEYRFTVQPYRYDNWYWVAPEGFTSFDYRASFSPIRYELLLNGEVTSDYYDEDYGWWFIPEDAADLQLRAYYGYGENDYVDSEIFFGRSRYEITVADTSNGTVTVSESNPSWDTAIIVEVTPADGYELESLSYVPEGGTATDITSDRHFVMPAANVTVNASFRAIGSSQPSTEPGGGSSQTPDTPSNTQPSGNGSSQSGNTVPTPAIPTDVPINVTTEPGVAGFVERLYTVALGRASDPVGKQDWIDAITLRGETGASAARGFLYSPEFLNKDCSNEEFVTVLYSTFFDRTPDNLGFTAWVEALNTGASKEQVIEGFINSTEWANLCLRYGIRSGGTGTPNIEIEPNEQTVGFATRLYTTCLNRDADEAGLMAWARQLANQRDTGTGAARGFFFSSEFTNQNVDNGEYVTRLYRTFMGREPDEAGFNAWVAQLDAGVSREEVFNGFAESPEFTRICSSYGIIR